MAEYTCMCGHVEEEHAVFGFFRECQEDGCDCVDYEEDR